MSATAHQRGIYLPDELAERVTALAQQEDRSWNAMLRVLVKEALEMRVFETVQKTDKP
jgi:predicted DNA-binding protein